MAGALLPIYDKLTSNFGLKLRLHIADTIFVENGRLVGWFFTCRDGICTKASMHETTSHAVLQKLGNQQVHDPALNPYSYVAVAHYENGAARLLKRAELQQMMAYMAGPYEPLEEAPYEIPWCLQSYIPPAKDLRYISAYAGTEPTEVTTFARRYSSRYTSTFDEPSAASLASPKLNFKDGRDHGVGPVDGPPDSERLMSAEELLSESQLIAAGLLDPRPPSASQPTASPSAANPTDKISAAPLRVRKEASRQLAAVSSFMERAHGIRLTGIVTEFIANNEGSLLLVLLHAAEWDGKGSRGRMGTFTERWSDYLAGLGPAPAPQPPSRRNQGPGVFLSASAELPSGPPSPKGAPSMSNTQRGGTQVITARPDSAPGHGHTRSTARSVASHIGGNTHYSLRNVVSATRKGAGGNPTASPTANESYRLWGTSVAATMSRPESVAGTLALELEVTRERLQRQMDSTARCEAALQALASSSTTATSNLKARCEALEREVEEARKSRAEAEAEAERLRTNRAAMRTTVSTLENEVASLRASLAADRETLALSLKLAQSKESALEQECRALRDENEELQSKASGLARRLDEESEVVEAARCQLMEYKQLVMQLQAQIKRTKAKGGANSAAVAALTGVPNSPTGGVLNNTMQLNASVTQARQMSALMTSHNVGQ